MGSNILRILVALWVLSFASRLDATISFERVYGGTNNDYGHSVQLTQDGGYIMVGETESFGVGDYDVYVIKTNANGDTIWTKTYGGAGYDCGQSVQQTEDGGYIIIGFTDSFGSGLFDFYLIKTDADGNTTWTKTYGTTDFDCGYSVQQTQDGGYIVVGVTHSGNTHWDVYLIKTDTDGNAIWAKTYSGTDDDWAYSVQQTQDSGYVIAGFTGSSGAGWFDVYLIKTDPDGVISWTKTYGGAQDDVGRSVQQTQDGGYIVAGWTLSFGTGAADVYLIKTDDDGIISWTKTYGGIQSDEGHSVRQTQDNGYIIGGGTESFGAAGANVYLIKTDTSGNVGIEEEETCNRKKDITLRAVPNPFYTKTKIYGANGEVEIYNSAGRVIWRTEKGIWGGEGVPAGIYFLKDKAQKKVKLIKLK